MLTAVVVLIYAHLLLSTALPIDICDAIDCLPIGNTIAINRTTARLNYPCFAAGRFGVVACFPMERDEHGDMACIGYTDCSAALNMSSSTQSKGKIVVPTTPVITSAAKSTGGISYYELAGIILGVLSLLGCMYSIVSMRRNNRSLETKETTEQTPQTIYEAVPVIVVDPTLGNVSERQTRRHVPLALPV